MRLTKVSTIFLVFVFFTTRVWAQSVIKGAVLENKAVRQYEKAEWDIGLTANWQNPYSQDDIALDMLLVAPGGKKLTVPCYYVNGSSGAVSQWKVRFLPQEKGKY